ncbi:MAG: hypothetical protein J5625_07225 [Lachnospiraceae bacterium]|nr:hypothetical protein [Lachnospiraceae bacterium]
MSKKTDNLIVSIPLILGLTGIVVFIVILLLGSKVRIDDDVLFVIMPLCIFAVGIVSAIIIGIIKRKSIKSKTGTKILFICGIICLFVNLIPPAIILGFLLLMISTGPKGLGDLFENVFKGTSEILFPDNPY